MTDNFRLKIRKLIKAGEGSIAHMYLDSVGKVTVGVGNLLPNSSSAAALPFIVESTGNIADSSKIVEEYDLVSEQESSRSASFYKQFTSLVLSEDEIDKLLDIRLDEFESGLILDFPDFNNYPENARLGIIDMAFNLGNKGLVKKFPGFTEAARNGDWERCAIECRRKQIQESRNAEVKKLFEGCINPELPE